MEKTLESLMEEFMKLPDWKRFPLPESLYTKFNLPKPQAVSINEYLQNHDPAVCFAPGETEETRPPAEGGVRIMPASTPLELTVETETEHPPEIQIMMVDSKESIEPKSLESISRSESSLHFSDDVPSTTPS